MEKKAIKFLQKNKKELFENWMNSLESSEIFREELISESKLRQQSKNFYDSFLHAIKSDNFDEPEEETYQTLVDLLTDQTLMRANQGYTAKENGDYLFKLKEEILKILEDLITSDPGGIINQLLSLSRLFDNLGMHTFQIFIKEREEIISSQMKEINEISTPVINLWNGILTLPIIGTLDSERAQTIMESLLQKITETDSTIAILDISGVSTVDSLVAQHLIKTATAAKLMGAECIISGMRPEIAQTIVHLGIDLQLIKTTSTMEGALKLAFNHLNYIITKERKK